MAETIEVPFIMVGNRRALTLQIIEDRPEVADFVNRFRDCFEFDPLTDLFFLDERNHPWKAGARQ